MDTFNCHCDSGKYKISFKTRGRNRIGKCVVKIEKFKFQPRPGIFSVEQDIKQRIKELGWGLEPENLKAAKIRSSC